MLKIYYVFNLIALCAFIFLGCSNPQDPGDDDSGNPSWVLKYSDNFAGSGDAGAQWVTAPLANRAVKSNDVLVGWGTAGGACILSASSAYAYDLIRIDSQFKHNSTNSSAWLSHLNGQTNGYLAIAEDMELSIVRWTTSPFSFDSLTNISYSYDTNTWYTLRMEYTAASSGITAVLLNSAASSTILSVSISDTNHSGLLKVGLGCGNEYTSSIHNASNAVMDNLKISSYE